MEIIIASIAYGWTAICAISHVRIEARKRREDTSMKNQMTPYVVQIIIYWIFTASILL